MFCYVTCLKILCDELVIPRVLLNKITILVRIWSFLSKIKVMKMRTPDAEQMLKSFSDRKVFGFVWILHLSTLTILH